jgi:hypothetical protein
VTPLGEVPRRRSNLEAGDTHRESPLERKLTTLKGLLVAGPTHILRRKEGNKSIPKPVVLKSSRNPNHPLSTGEMKKGEEAEPWFLGLKKYFRVHDYSENLKAQNTHIQPEWKGFYMVGRT